MKAIATNFAKGMLESAITAEAASLTLESGKGSLFPAPLDDEMFLAVIINEDDEDLADYFEVIQVEIRADDTLSDITRDLEGSNPPQDGWPAGSLVICDFTAGLFARMAQKSEAESISGAWQFLNFLLGHATPALVRGLRNVDGQIQYQDVDGDWFDIDSGAGVVMPYRDTFNAETDTERIFFTGDFLTIVHNTGALPVFQIFDDNDIPVAVSVIRMTTTEIDIDFTGVTIDPDWSFVFSTGGQGPAGADRDWTVDQSPAVIHKNNLPEGVGASVNTNLPVIHDEAYEIVIPDDLDRLHVADSVIDIPFTLGAGTRNGQYIKFSKENTADCLISGAIYDDGELYNLLTGTVLGGEVGLRWSTVLGAWKVVDFSGTWTGSNL